jgi:hypothetical protein
MEEQMTPATQATEDWASLEDHVAPDGTFAPPTRPESKGPHAKVLKYPCGACGGSGKWRGGRVNNNGSSKCFACKGEGYFKTSEQDRRNARMQKATSKARKLAEAQTAFNEQHPGIAEFLAKATWSTFAQELAGKLAQYGSLTEPQVAAVRNMMAKVESKRAERAVEREANKQTVDLAPIRAMFESARASGHKKPIYRAAGLVISRAPDGGKNPGALYVKTVEGDEYLGKILGTDYTGKPAPALAAIAADPRGEAVRYGQRTGQCSCCGRELTAEGSVNLGIGPICASKWGL